MRILDVTPSRQKRGDQRRLSPTDRARAPGGANPARSDRELLAGTVVHDLNNLLAVVLGHLEMLLLELDAGRARRTAALGHEAALKAAALAQRLLESVRLDRFAPGTVDLNRIVLEAARLLRPTLGDDLRLETELSIEPCPLHSDPDQLIQAIVNLVINAQEAMPDGGTIRLRTENRQVESGGVGGGDMPPGRYVVLAVDDTGTGMDSATLDRAFEPFFTTKVRGTGLGLASILGVVKRSGGFITTSSLPDEGSTFELYFPRQPRNRPRRGSGPHPTPQSGDEIPQSRRRGEPAD